MSAVHIADYETYIFEASSQPFTYYFARKYSVERGGFIGGEALGARAPSQPEVGVTILDTV